MSTLYHDTVKVVREGKPFLNIFLDLLKNETLKLTKVFTGRIFNAEDTLGVLIERKFLGDFYARSTLYDPVVGVGCDSTLDFNSYFKSFNPFTFKLCIDYKRWDKSVAASLVEILLEALILVNPHMEKALRAVFYSIFKCIHVSGHTMYWIAHGMSSGCAGTANLNSKFNHILHFVVYCILHHEQYGYYPTWQKFKTRCRCIFYGDDVLIASLDDWFNKQSIARVAKQYFNMHADAMDKQGEELSATDTWDDINWISRYWRKLDDFDFYVGALKKIAIGGLLHWTTSITYSQMASNIQNAILEAALWEQEFYDQVCRDARKAIQMLPGLNSKICFPLRSTVQYNIYLSATDPRVLLGQSTDLAAMSCGKATVKTHSTMTNYVSLLNEMFQAGKIAKPIYTYQSRGPGENLTWICYCDVGADTFHGMSSSKALAKEMAAQFAYKRFCPDTYVQMQSQSNDNICAILAAHGFDAYVEEEPFEPRSWSRILEPEPYNGPPEEEPITNMVARYVANRPRLGDITLEFHQRSPFVVCCTAEVDEVYAIEYGDDEQDATIRVCDRLLKKLCDYLESYTIDCEHFDHAKLTPMSSQSMVKGMATMDIGVPEPSLQEGTTEGTSTTMATGMRILNPMAAVMDNINASGEPYDMPTFLKAHYGLYKKITISSTDSPGLVYASIKIDPSTLDGTMIQAYSKLHKYVVPHLDIVLRIYGTQGLIGGVVAYMSTDGNTPGTLDGILQLPYWELISFNAVTSTNFLVNDQRPDGFYRTMGLAQPDWPSFHFALHRPPMDKFVALDPKNPITIDAEIYVRLGKFNQFFGPIMPVARPIANAYSSNVALGGFLTEAFDMVVANNFVSELKQFDMLQFPDLRSPGKVDLTEWTADNFYLDEDVNDYFNITGDYKAVNFRNVNLWPDESTMACIPQDGKTFNQVIVIGSGRVPNVRESSYDFLAVRNYLNKFEMTQDRTKDFPKYTGPVLSNTLELSIIMPFPEGFLAIFVPNTTPTKVKRPAMGSESTEVYDVLEFVVTDKPGDSARLIVPFGTNIATTEENRYNIDAYTASNEQQRNYGIDVYMDEHFSANSYALEIINYDTKGDFQFQYTNSDNDLYDYQMLGPNYCELHYKLPGLMAVDKNVRTAPGFATYGLSHLEGYLTAAGLSMGATSVAYSLLQDGTLLADVAFINKKHIVRSERPWAAYRNVAGRVLITNIRPLSSLNELTSFTTFPDPYVSGATTKEIIPPKFLIPMTSQAAAAAAGTVIEGIGAGFNAYWNASMQQKYFEQQERFHNDALGFQKWKVAENAAQQQRMAKYNFDLQMAAKGYGAAEYGGTASTGLRPIAFQRGGTEGGNHAVPPPAELRDPNNPGLQLDSAGTKLIDASSIGSASDLLDGDSEEGSIHTIHSDDTDIRPLITPNPSVNSFGSGSSDLIKLPRTSINSTGTEMSSSPLISDSHYGTKNVAIKIPDRTEIGAFRNLIA